MTSTQNTVYSRGIPVPQVDDDGHFYNRLTILYGPSGSGKSSLIQHLLNSLRDVVPIAIVCCPTATVNGDYAGIIPDECVYDDVSKSLLQRIFQRQNSVMAMYKMVRDIDNLKPLFWPVATEDARRKVSRLTAIFDRGSTQIKATYSEEDVEGAIADLTAKYHKKMVKIMRATIGASIIKLHAFALTDLQKTLLDNFEINPSLLLLIDDCMASIKEWKDLEETKKLFYQGRHYFVTTLISAQNEVCIPPSFRINAHINMFTTETIVNSFINKVSSGISASERKLISQIAQTIFAPSSDTARPNFKKLVIFGQIIKTNSKIQYMIAIPKKKKFGSAAVWSMCSQVKRGTTAAVTSNAFSKMFAMKTVASLDLPPQRF